MKYDRITFLHHGVICRDGDFYLNGTDYDHVEWYNILAAEWAANIQKGGHKMDDIYVTVERHEQKLNTLERDVAALREVQGEIRSMNQTLLTLANELKHTNEHLARHERKIEEIDN